MTRRERGNECRTTRRRRSIWMAAASAILLLLLATKSAHADPQFKKVGQTATAEAYTSTFPATSASLAFRAAFEALAHACDSKPTLETAVRNAAGDTVQGFFHASMHGAPVRGMITAKARQGAGTAAVILERAASFPQSLVALSKQVAADLPPPAAGGSVQALTVTKLPDGGTISLAPGWRVTSNVNGGVEATNGASSLSLGVSFSVMVRHAGRPNPNVLSGPYEAPWPALQHLIDVHSKGGVRSGDVTLTLIQQTPAAGFPGAQAERITVDITPRGGAAIRARYLMVTKQINHDVWYVHMSEVQAPSARFGEELPTLRAMWDSWHISPQVLQAHMDSAERSRRDIAEMHRQSIALKSRAGDIAALGHDEYLRDVETIEHVPSGARGQFDSHYADALVDALNRNGGNYRIVPPSELVP